MQLLFGLKFFVHCGVARVAVAEETLVGNSESGQDSSLRWAQSSWSWHSFSFDSPPSCLCSSGYSDNFPWVSPLKGNIGVIVGSNSRVNSVPEVVPVSVLS